ncbi:hypothetical protein ZHAS_00012308 [Anopheles sinensis]|uniref:Uncharacterized protein n=1 Tax=Anopheles sinensis TaxID=74873 RepID=A0A084W2C3_ANOSI|nr:hypothetical protein ZHAS_00012308 [Anopheles sinensis]
MARLKDAIVLNCKGLPCGGYGGFAKSCGTSLEVRLEMSLRSDSQTLQQRNSAFHGHFTAPESVAKGMGMASKKT